MEFRIIPEYYTRLLRKKSGPPEKQRNYQDVPFLRVKGTDWYRDVRLTRCKYSRTLRKLSDRHKRALSKFVPDAI